MADLWVLVPSRGRPANVERLVKHCALTCTADTRLHFGFDQDDPAREENIAAAGGHRYTVSQRMGLTGWTNELAARHIKRGDASVLGSVGDDMVPVTHGWDTRLLAVLEEMGGGFVYPDDRRRDDIPEAVFMSVAIPRALGWMALPTTHHWWIDNVWRDLGAACGRIRYCPDILVEHKHPNVPGGDPPDATYHDAAAHYQHDSNAYRSWRLRRMPFDIRTVKEALGVPAAA